MTIETDTRCTLCGRCSLWCTCIGTFAVPCVDAGVHPRRGEGEQEGAAHRNPKFNRALLRSGSVDHLNHNEGISRG